MFSVFQPVIRSDKRLKRLAPLSLCLAVALAGCSGLKDDSKFPVSKYGPASPRMVDDGEPVPKGGGVYKVGKPYRVAGRWYHPEEDENYDRTGMASWYGPTFHGRQTANGEVFDRYALTGAHPTLPIPSYVRVTNTRNNHSVIVRINDRGPFSDKRIIDLSERTAELLDFKQAGLTQVRVQYVGKAPLEGDDTPMLMASFSRSGDAQFPGTAFADAGRASPMPTTSIGRDPNQVVTLAAADQSSSQNTIRARSVVPVPMPVSAPVATAYQQPAPAYQQPAQANQQPAQAPVVLASSAASYPVATAGGETVLQLGVFGDQGNAHTLAQRMGHLGRVSIEPVAADTRPLYRVRIAVQQADLEAAYAQARLSGIHEPRIIAH